MTPSLELDLDYLYFNSDSLFKQSNINQALAYPTFLSSLEKLAKNASDIIDAVWNNDKSELPLLLFNAYNQNLHKAVDTGNDPSLNDPSHNLLRNNVSRLAAAKTNYILQQLQHLRNSLRHDPVEYTRQAKLILARANSTQAAEFNTAVHRARVAKQWEQFQGERHIYPNIQWLHTRSASPREIHLAYVGRIWPMDDPFWNSNSPGCTWNCKCSWKSTDEAPTDNNKLVQVQPSPGLEGNPYETKKIFSDNHPYFSRVDKHIPKLGPLHNPDDIAFIQKTTNEGHKYLEHFNCREAGETTENAKIVAELLKGGFKDIKLMPTIHTDEKALRERYFGKAYNDLHKTSNPDAIIDGNIVEFKSSNYSNAVKRINLSAKKSNIAVIKASEIITENGIKRILISAWKQSPNIQKIVIINDGKTLIFHRKG